MKIHVKHRYTEILYEEPQNPTTVVSACYNDYYVVIMKLLKEMCEQVKKINEEK